MKKLSIFIALILTLIFLTGCWDYSEIEDIAIASGMTVDLDENGLYLVNVELVDINPSTSGVDLSPLIVEAEGNTIIEAIRNIISISMKRVRWSHGSYVIISQEAAKKGLIPLVDWIARHPEARLTIHILVSKENTAKEIMLEERPFAKIRALEFEKFVKSSHYLSKLPHVEVYRLINQISNKNLYSVLPTIELKDINNKGYSKMMGSAYFAHGKLEGFLDSMETMKYLFILDEIEGGLLIVPTGDNTDDKVSLDILKNKTHIDIDIEDDNITFIININTTVNIAEVDNGVNYSDIEGRSSLKKIAEEFLEDELESFIRYTQKDIGLDIFGFGNMIRKKNKHVWKAIEENWDSIFKEVNVVVNSNIKIRNSEHISKSIKADE